MNGDGTGYVHLNRSDASGVSEAPVHTGINDLESFFWVLVYQGLCREGPGGTRRHKLVYGESSENPTSGWSMTSEEVVTLKDYVFKLFNYRNGGQTKLQLFRDPPAFENETLPLFHPYFERLKPLLLEWWNLLLCTYKSYDAVVQGLIHDKVLIMLNKHLDLIRTGKGEMEPNEVETSEEVNLRRQTELERRRLDLHTLQLSPWTSTGESAVHDMDNEPGSSPSAEVSEDEIWTYRASTSVSDSETSSHHCSGQDYQLSPSTNDGSELSDPPGPSNLTRKFKAMAVKDDAGLTSGQGREESKKKTTKGNNSKGKKRGGAK
ncbi:hypothetical protein EUX98_g6265 [Antrodiella citrinella]|uniref:Fungal-type protein kinase domain-containing protein n=1 Tax=Antrodiella citrinella TaxID=2447956 RepID=A0A4S4MPD8_9APHY|nr:hypothetical protein EUX98_g6265 [Antrodiella citrinella]